MESSMQTNVTFVRNDTKTYPSGATIDQTVFDINGDEVTLENTSSKMIGEQLNDYDPKGLTISKADAVKLREFFSKRSDTNLAKAKNHKANGKAKQSQAATKRAGYAKEQIKLIDAYGIACFGAVKPKSKPKATKIAPKSQPMADARIDAIEQKLDKLFAMLTAK
jgi:hypothetical protein